MNKNNSIIKNNEEVYTSVYKSFKINYSLIYNSNYEVFRTVRKDLLQRIFYFSHFDIKIAILFNINKN